MTTPQELKQIVFRACCPFPLTDFDAQGNFRRRDLRRAPRMAGALRRDRAVRRRRHRRVLLADAERLHRASIKAAVDTCRGKVPILAGAGGPTRIAIEYAQEAERLGAHGVLLLPHYLTEASQEGLVAHVEAVCNAREVRRRSSTTATTASSTPTSLAQLADRCPNLIGFKDGVGDIETMVSIRRRWATASPTSAACRRRKSMPRPTRRWACRCIRRRCSTSFRRRRWTSTTRSRTGRPRDHRPPDRRLLPAVPGDPQPPAGYAVSIVKAGAKLVGHGAGPVRAAADRPDRRKS